jgi:glycerophosphoryl diester phosphodiesterase
MQKALAHTQAHSAPKPTLSPVEQSVLGADAKPRPMLPAVDVPEIHALGLKVVAWTTDDAETMRVEIARGVDGIITNRPDLLREVVKEARANAKTEEEKQRLAHFDLSAHRGGMNLRPENTLPSFESGLDEGATTLETDTGVSTDHKSTIWHDQFYNPESCRRADGAAYTLENRVYLKDISSVDAQKTFICDKLHHGDLQKNDLALSPVAVAFAKKEGMPSPYVPTYVDQLFRFVRFYAEYYSTGAGSKTPHAKERAAAAKNVRFNIETKSVPEPTPATIAAMRAGKELPYSPENYVVRTADPQTFVTTLAGTIMREHMEGRAEIQSFDFRTLVLIEEQFPKIPTFYLTQNPRMLYSEAVPLALRSSKD